MSPRHALKENKGRASGAAAAGEPWVQMEQQAVLAHESIEALMEVIREPVLVLDAGLCVHQANRCFYQTFHLTPEQTLHRPVYELDHCQWDIPQLHQLLEQKISGSCQIEDQELTHRFGTLGKRTLLLCARKVPHDPGRVLLAIQDITVRKRRERALRRSRARIRQQLAEIEAIYNSALVGLCVLDRDLRYQRVNQRMAEMNGVAASLHIGRTVREIVPSVADTAEQLGRRVFETGQPILNLELTGTTAARPGVQGFWVEQWVPVKDERGQVIAINVAAEEITERKLAEERLRRSESRFRGLTEQIPQLVWTSDPDGQCDYLSPQWAAYTGVPLQQQLGLG